MICTTYPPKSPCEQPVNNSNPQIKSISPQIPPQSYSPPKPPRRPHCEQVPAKKFSKNSHSGSRRSPSLGVQRHVAALELADMSASSQIANGKQASRCPVSTNAPIVNRKCAGRPSAALLNVPTHCYPMGLQPFTLHSSKLFYCDPP